MTGHLKPINQADKLKPTSRTRRTSSVGKIDLGDTVPGLSASSNSKETRHASKERVRRLSSSNASEINIWQRFWLNYRELSYQHTWVTPLVIMSVVYAGYLVSGDYTPNNPLHMFVTISYQVGETNEYGKGIKDLCFILFYMVFFTFLREFLMDVVIRPLTLKLGVRSNHRIKRMMEQVYAIIYYGVSGPIGLYLMYDSDLWFFETAPMYLTYPDFTNSYKYKWFYLGQASFWAQQAAVLVLQLEKPRKDYPELVFHHIVTLLLIWSSYVFHFTKMGLFVYVTMDISDFWLSLSKTVNYLDHPSTPTVFITFIFHWVYLRHWVNMRILWSVLTEFRTVGDFVLNFATQQYKCWISLPIVFSLIAALQLVNLYWLFLILRILYRLLKDNVRKDERSESESDEEELAQTPTNDESNEAKKEKAL
ncbi:hypothetical protein ZYGR_0E00540 [Zygosaccharomyces rouxii]|uniref:TLC domain-containing protein n=1 Tax=Zygosaccharomyces rouxii TaxID=4956 RepID=A0A1Q2ZUR9_ZYGRO|nr:hypothetical protein ZYGR_0E00540 [Zygosaccharomyces rouxii]